MTARILIVDDIITNIKVLEAKLRAEYYEVLTASSGPEGLAIAQKDFPDLILLDVMMPVMDGFEVCRRLKAAPATAHIPVVMVTALDGVEDRVRGLEAGADDFLTKPIDEMALMARIKNLVRLKLMRDELRLRQDTVEAMADIVMTMPNESDTTPRRILLLEDMDASAQRMVTALQSSLKATVERVRTPQEAFAAMVETAPDLIILTLTSDAFDGLRACSQIRTLDFLRQVPILAIGDQTRKDVLFRALDLSVNDYLVRPIDRNELIARVATQFRWKTYSDRLREIRRQSIELAATDPLTGLHNRRYLAAHLARQITRSKETRKPCTVLILDIDYFKRINDTYGHQAGDEVLKALADSFRFNIRGVDLACRYGGEEFVIVMPETELAVAEKVAERLREAIAEHRFKIGEGKPEIPVTASIGLATLDPTDTEQTLIERADKALYEAKATGRNKVVVQAA
ncbi:MAG: PleD family two-component system response regulator [Alphaproteobacteria bacterium]